MSTEELSLLRKFKNGDNSVLDELLSYNAKLLSKIAANHYGVNSSIYDDLLQEGRLGLIEAFRRFDEDKIKTFGFYKSIWIRKKMSKYVESFGNFGKHSPEHFPDSPYSDLRVDFRDAWGAIKKSTSLSEKEVLDIENRLLSGSRIKKQQRLKLQKIYEQD